MFTSELDKLLISESFKDEEVEETCDAQHSEITSPDDGSGVKGNAGGRDIETEGFMWYDCDIDEASVIDGDPFEFLTEAMYQNIINANNISIAVLADRYKYLRENGEEMIDEAAEEQNEKKKGAIKKWFDKAANAISKFIQTVLDKMLRLQAKFLTLFKQARGSSEKGYKGRGFTAPNYDPLKVKEWANAEFNNAEKEGKYNPLSAKSLKEVPADFKTDLEVIKSYGGNMRIVKDLGKAATGRLKRAAKDAESENNAGGVSYAKCGNAVTDLTKEAVSLILKRTNIAAKNIAASLRKPKTKKEDDAVETKEEKKTEEPKADDKKTATGESTVSFLDSLDFI